MTGSRTARAVALIVLAVVVSLAGCAGRGEAPAAVDRDDPLRVIVVALETMFTWDPATHSSPGDASSRAIPYLGDSLANLQPQLVETGAGQRWQIWAQERARVSARVDVLADLYPEEPDRTHRTVTITQTVVSADGTVEDRIQLTAWVIAAKHTDGWRVDTVDFRSAAT